ncbi:MAG: superoxide dismutase [Actinomycetota bacterium]
MGTRTKALAVAAVAGILISATAWAGEKPQVIDLPDGFQPEGIETAGTTFYAGSIPTGAIFQGDLGTGEGDVFIPARDGRSAIGLALGHGLLFVAGGTTGDAYVYDARTGEPVDVFRLATRESFVNDVVATSEAAYFTDSVNQVLYKVPITGGGELGSPDTIPLTGDLEYSDGFNANGIDATSDGDTLVIVQSNKGLLFTADPDTGATQSIDLGGETVTNGDGIVLEPDDDLWVLRNGNNLLVLIDLARDLGSGEVAGEFTHDTFDVPTTLARSGDRLAIVNSRFGTTDSQPADYWITQIRRPKKN